MAGGGGTDGGSVDLMTPAGTVSFRDINRDMDALGCTGAIKACHGTDAPIGKMKLKPDGLTKAADLMANFMEATAAPRVDAQNKAASTLLTKPLGSRADVTHGGPKVWTNDQDPDYRRWLKWIECGAKFDSVMTSACGSPPAGDMGGS